MLRVRAGHVVVSTDLLVEGRHFRRDWASAEDVGHRAAAQNLSDINAMGGRPLAHHRPRCPGRPARPVGLDFARGFADECALVGASVVGGDLTWRTRSSSRSPRSAPAPRPVLARAPSRVRCWRSPAARAGRPAGCRAGPRLPVPRVLVDAYRRPEPPYAAGPAAAAGGDRDDRRLRRPGRRRRTPGGDSGVAIDLRSAPSRCPSRCTPWPRPPARDPLALILGGGEDHSLLATFDPGASRGLDTAARGEGVTWARRRGRPGGDF